MNPVHNMLSSAFSVVETVYDDAFMRGNGKWVEFEFTIERSCFDDYGNDNGSSVIFAVRYRSFESYVRVEWRVEEVMIAGEHHPELNTDWMKIAEHDSTWRKCWEDTVLEFCQDVLIARFEANGNNSFGFSCNYVQVYDER